MMRLIMQLYCEARSHLIFAFSIVLLNQQQGGYQPQQFGNQQQQQQPMGGMQLGGSGQMQGQMGGGGQFGGFGQMVSMPVLSISADWLCVTDTLS